MISVAVPRLADGWDVNGLPGPDTSATDDDRAAATGS